MTMPTETPEATDAATGQGNGAADGMTGSATDSAAQTTSAPQTDSGQEPAGGKGDMISRVRSDPDYAEDRVKFFQGEAARARNAAGDFDKRLGSLKDLLKMDGVNGDQIAGLANAALALGRHPDYADAIRAAASGDAIPNRAAPASDDDEDEYLDPTVKALRDQYAELSQMVKGLGHQMSQRDQQTGSERFTAAVQSWIQANPDLTDEEISRIRDKGSATVDRLGSDALKLSEEDVHKLMMSTFSPDEWRAVVKRGVVRELQNQHQRTTDGPSSASISANAPENLKGSDHRTVWEEACRRFQ